MSINPFISSVYVLIGYLLVLNRDINSANIMVGQKGDWDARLTGFFRCCQRGYQSGQLTFELSDDIFCLGLVMAEMVLGGALWQSLNVSIDGLSDAQLRKLVQTKRVAVVDTKLRKLIPFQCPESFEALICECCSSDASRRPSVEACIDALTEILEDMGSSDEQTKPSMEPQQIKTQSQQSSPVTSTAGLKPIIANKRGSIDPNMGTMTFYPRARPEQELHNQIHSLEAQLNDLKRQAQQQYEVNVSASGSNGANFQSDVMLAAILQVHMSN